MIQVTVSITVPKSRKYSKYNHSYMHIGFTEVQINGDERAECVISIETSE